MRVLTGVVLLRKTIKPLAAILLSMASAASYADGTGVINDMHWAYWDQDQSSTICFEVNGVGLAFVSNGSDKAKAVIALLISAFETGRTISYASASAAMSPTPCQSWEIPASIYQVTAISFQ